MDIPDNGIVIVGAGQAGANMAFALRKYGYIGRVTLIGDESFLPYERPPLSKDVLQGKSGVEKCMVRADGQYAEHRIDVLLSDKVTAIDRAARTVCLLSGKVLSYDKLVLATGARARRLALPGANDPRVHVLRTVADTLALREALQQARKLILIGGGFIGLEVAASARSMGLEVCVLEQAPQLMGRVLPAEVAGYVGALHAKNGVDIKTGVVLKEIISEPQLLARTSVGDFSSDLIVVGIGSIPNGELAVQSGLAVEDGIVVDACGQTSDPYIYAVGDVTRHPNAFLGRALRLESWQNAQNQAIAVAQILAGGAQPYAEIPWVWTDQYSMNLQMAGLVEPDLEWVRRGGAAADNFTMIGLREGVPRCAITVNQGRDMRFAKQLLAKATPIQPSTFSDLANPLQKLAA